MNAMGGRESGETFQPADFFPALPDADDAGGDMNALVADLKERGARDLRESE